MSHWHLTGVEGVLLGAALTAVAGVATAPINQRGQRNLNAADRLWDKRAGLYVELIKAIHFYEMRWSDEPWTDLKLGATADHLAEVLVQEPEMRAFGTADAGELYRQYARAVADLFDGLDGKLTAKDTVKALGRRVIDQLRADLGDGR